MHCPVVFVVVHLIPDTLIPFDCPVYHSHICEPGSIGQGEQFAGINLFEYDTLLLCLVEILSEVMNCLIKCLSGFILQCVPGREVSGFDFHEVQD